MSDRDENIYTGFAYYYDDFMDDIPYDEWAEKITGILKSEGINDGIVCELGCGTGEMTVRLSDAGYDMIGIDISEDMLALARDKMYESGREGILYLLQDMRKLELFGTVKAFVSVCDSMNYIVSDEDMLEILKNTTLVCGEIENPKTHHAPAGAIVAKKNFGVDDEEILSAIRWHTIGKLNMTKFEKIIFLADKIEKTRPDDYAEPIRNALFNKGIDEALLVCYKSTIKSLVDRNLTICTATIDIYNELLTKTST